MESPLDNPAWWALNSYHASFALGGGEARRYRPGILPFAACRSADRQSLDELAPLIAADESFYLIGDMPPLPAAWVIEQEIPCAQMIGPKQIPRVPEKAAINDSPVSLLGEADRDDMYSLVNLVQPGFYLRNTPLLGTYYGIRQEGRLVAMAGERIRLSGSAADPHGHRDYTELSAICTHPDYTGRKYAQRLIVGLCRTKMAAGIVPVLHVAKSNERAIRLYEHLDFTPRRDIFFRRLRKK